MSLMVARLLSFFQSKHLRHTTTFNVHLLILWKFDVYPRGNMKCWFKREPIWKLNKNGDDDAELSQIRSGTSSSKAKDISKNCPKADSSWNGIEIADTLWFERTEEPGRN
ncbi:hypothetical protein OIU84_025830 [Salix udensis]|uniref:Uncharacterized protein n=1 Tax=Salix udensis TaxID=889485 RepID=A0AAD6KMC1_9ROSI|nr:hypothetical protein OIU84_025830 [Salix udensis]